METSSTCRVVPVMDHTLPPSAITILVIVGVLMWTQANPYLTQQESQRPLIAGSTVSKHSRLYFYCTTV